jgi:hypothetical protein
MVSQKIISRNIFLLIVLLSSYSALLADGCLFLDIDKIGNPAESPNQRALIIHDGKTETLVLQVKYSGTVENFAWVVPLPTLPEENSITTASDSIFKELHDGTQPRVYRTYRHKDAYRGGGGGEGDLSPISETTVHIWENLRVGPYDVAVLSGSSAQALIDWLNANGYHIPGEAHAIIDFYIQKSWVFIATRVELASTLDKNNSTYQAGLPALKMQFQTDKPVFPLRISELSSARENEIELYMAGPHRIVCETYQTEPMNRDEVQRMIEEQISKNNQNSTTGIACACQRITNPALLQSDYDYEKIFREKILSFSEPTFIVEYASMEYTSHDPSEYPKYGSFNGYFNDYFPNDTEFWLTRLRTLMTPDQMQEDVSFVPDPNGDEWFSLWIHLEDKAPNPWSATVLSLPGIFLLPLFSSKKIRKRHWRTLLMAILMITIVTL